MLSAAISFYAIFSLAPIAVIAVAVAGLILEDELLRAEIQGYVERELGPEPARLVGDMMMRTATPGTSGLLASLAGVAVLLFASSRLFTRFQQALDQIWGRTSKPSKAFGQKILRLASKRLLSFGLVFLMGVLLLASVVVSTVVSAVGEELSAWVHIPEALTRAVELGAVGLVLTGAFTLLYKLLPDVRVDWPPALAGAILATVLFSMGRVALGAYIGHGAVASTYGAAGSLVVLVLWIYYSTQVVFFGAVFSRVLTEDRKRKEPLSVRPSWHFHPPPAWDKNGPDGAGRKAEPRKEQPGLSRHR